MLSIEHLSLLILRVVFGGVMLVNHGLPKLKVLTGYQSAATLTQEGDSVFMLTLAVISEFGCSLFVVLGLFTRWASLPLIAAMGLGLYFSFGNGLSASWELMLLYLAGFIVLFLKGGGRWSIDRYLFQSPAKSSQW